ncbi:MAG: beta strand repeat-containing protein, partial [Cyanophyceae cyanobacterium]
TQSLRILSTANQLTTVGDGAQTMQLSFTANMVAPGNITITGSSFKPLTDSNTNIGNGTDKFLNLYVDAIADDTNAFGAANQVLSAGTGGASLSWIDIPNEDLSVRIGPSGGATFVVDLATEMISFVGTTDEIEVLSPVSETVAFRLPTTITTRGAINSQDIKPQADMTYDIGTSSTKYKDLYVRSIADGADSLGGANMVLAKNAANTALEWTTPDDSSLEFVGDNITGTPSVDLNSQSFRVFGTANQIGTTAIAQTLTFSLPAVLIAPGSVKATTNLIATGDVLPVSDSTSNLASATEKFLALYADLIYDASNSAGTSGQVLSSTGSGLSWVANTGTDDLQIAGDTGTGVVDLPTQTLTVAGTANEIETVGGSQTITVAFPTDITTKNNVTVTGSIAPLNDSTSKLGTAAEKWLALAADDILDGSNSTGTEYQVLRKNSGNTALEWYVPTAYFAGDTGTGSFNIGHSDSTSPIRLLGTTNQITTLGDGTRTVTYSIPSTFIAPGSIESTTTTTVGTDLLPTTDITTRIGGSAKRILRLYLSELYDHSNSGGTSGQVLSSNASGQLAWVAQNNSTLNFDDGTTSGSVDLPTQSLSIQGTTNEITATALNQRLTLSLPTNILVPGEMAITTSLTPASNGAVQLGGSSLRWSKIFVNDIDAVNGGVGTAGQYLVKNGSNELSWTTVSANSLEFLGDSNTGTPTVALGSQSLTIAGTANEIVTSGNAQALTIAFPTDITTKGEVNSVGIVKPTTDQAIDLGTSALRWKDIYVKEIRDAGDNVGTSGQILAKNPANTGLIWVNSGTANVVEVVTTVSNAEMMALATTPIELVPAPGAGKMISVVECLWKLNHTAPNFDFTNDVAVRFNGGGTNIQFQPFLNFDNGMLNSGSDFYQTIPPAQSNGNANGQIKVNAALELFADTNPTQGGGSTKFKIKYRIEDAF